MEHIYQDNLIKTIKANCRNPISPKTRCITCQSETNYSDGIYLNLFHENLYLMRSNTIEYKKVIKDETRDYRESVRSPDYVDETIDFLNKNCGVINISRIKNLDILIKSVEINEVLIISLRKFVLRILFLKKFHSYFPQKEMEIAFIEQ